MQIKHIGLLLGKFTWFDKFQIFKLIQNVKWLVFLWQRLWLILIAVRGLMSVIHPANRWGLACFIPAMGWTIWTFVGVWVWLPFWSFNLHLKGSQNYFHELLTRLRFFINYFTRNCFHLFKLGIDKVSLIFDNNLLHLWIWRLLILCFRKVRCRECIF